MNKIIFLFSLLTIFPFSICADEIHKAAYEGNLEKLREIISADPKAVNKPDSQGNSPIFWAVFSEKAEQVVKFLLDKSADLRVSDNNGDTVLHFVTRDTPDSEMVLLLLLQKGAMVNASNKNGETPIHKVSSKEKAAILLRNGADIAAVDNDGNGVLHWVIESWPDEKIDLIEFLVKSGAPAGIKNKIGDTPLKRARVLRKKKILDFLESFKK